MALFPKRASWLESEYRGVKCMFCVNPIPAFGNGRDDVHGWVFRKYCQRWEKLLSVRLYCVGNVQLSLDPKTGIFSAKGGANNEFKGKAIFTFDLNPDCPAKAGSAGNSAARRREPATKAGGKDQITNSIGMKLVQIPDGEFMMGAPESPEELAKEFGCGAASAVEFLSERPQHRVRITRPFYLGAHTVTVAQFRRFIDETKYKTDAEKHVIRNESGIWGGVGYSADARPRVRSIRGGTPASRKRAIAQW